MFWLLGAYEYSNYSNYSEYSQISMTVTRNCIHSSSCQRVESHSDESSIPSSSRQSRKNLSSARRHSCCETAVAPSEIASPREKLLQRDSLARGARSKSIISCTICPSARRWFWKHWPPPPPWDAVMSRRGSSLYLLQVTVGLAVSDAPFFYWSSMMDVIVRRDCWVEMIPGRKKWGDPLANMLV